MWLHHAVVKDDTGNFTFGTDDASSLVTDVVQYSGLDGFNGAIDEIRFYKRVLSDDEAAGLADLMTSFVQPIGALINPQYDSIDLDGSSNISLKDYATLADSWPEEVLWPEM